MTRNCDLIVRILGEGSENLESPGKIEWVGKNFLKVSFRLLNHMPPQHEGMHTHTHTHTKESKLMGNIHQIISKAYHHCSKIAQTIFLNLMAPSPILCFFSKIDKV